MRSADAAPHDPRAQDHIQRGDAVMLNLGTLAFTTPWLLLGLIILPILWVLLRAVPPAPIRRRFPGRRAAPWSRG